jgi:hypothetical protein
VVTVEMTDLDAARSRVNCVNHCHDKYERFKPFTAPYSLSFLSARHNLFCIES